MYLRCTFFCYKKNYLHKVFFLILGVYLTFRLPLLQRPCPLLCLQRPLKYYIFYLDLCGTMDESRKKASQHYIEAVELLKANKFRNTY